MKITGPGGPAASQTGPRTARSPGGFSLGGAAAAASPAAAPAVSASGGVAGVSALMALQGVEDATERRRRALRRGGGLLDRLDDLKMAMLSGEAAGPALERLARATAETVAGELEPDLASVLAQIDLRAAVELAKAEAARVAPRG